MKNINKFALFFLFSFLLTALAGCSGSNKGSVDDNGSNNGNTGTDPSPELQLTPATFDFGTITQGNTALPFELTISNIGTSRLDIASILLSDTNNFLVDINAGSTPCGTASPAIDAGTNCTAEISFQPNQAGTFPATLDIVSNDPNSPDQLPLTGTSEAVAPVMNVTINQVELAGCPDVTAFVSVTDQGNFPIEGLTNTDFNIVEDATTVGNPIATTVDDVTKPISIALVMDYSSSMTDNDIREMENSAIDIVEQLKGSDEAEIIKFDFEPHVEQTFTSNQNDLITAINSILDNQGTALYAAIQLAIDHTELRPSERKAVIVITDGNDSISTDPNGDRSAIINDAMAKDIPVYVIALGNNIDTVVLNEITDGTSAEFYEADVAQNLRTIIDQQLAEVIFVDQYVLNYTSMITGGGTVNLTVNASKTGGFNGSDSRDIPQCP